MSRIGKKPIQIPSGVEVTLGGLEISVKGPKGTLFAKLHDHVSAKLEGSALYVQVDNPTLKQDRALWGLYRSLLSNMVKGVTEGFEKKMEINGVGFRASVSGNKLVLNIGFSHPVELAIPAGLTAAIEKNILTVSGIDKQAVGHFAAVVRAQKVPEPYKGKGIRYIDEVVRRKAGKAAKAVGA